MSATTHIWADITAQSKLNRGLLSLSQHLLSSVVVFYIVSYYMIFQKVGIQLKLMVENIKAHAVPLFVLICAINV